MISAPDRRKTVELINEAREAGARLEPACRVVGICSRTYQRWTWEGEIKADGRPTAKRPEPSNKLTKKEIDQVLSVCHDPKYGSLPPGQIVPRLADQGVYIASESSFYRILHKAGEQNHRGRSRSPRKTYSASGILRHWPEPGLDLDITWLPSQIRGMYFYLYMIVDVYSRMIIRWEIHPTESAELGANLVQKAVLAQNCILNPPVLHADNGGPQKGYTMRAKLDALGVTKSYSRPRVSNDNPYSESLFRTCKYRPDYPGIPFPSIEAARKWVAGFVNWYNHEHLHSAIQYVRPVDRHTGKDREILKKRKSVYSSARSRKPERWSRDTRNWNPIGPVWLNPPKEEVTGPNCHENGYRMTG